VQGIFTRSLDIALLSGSIDIAVHSMKDVPTQLPQGIASAAVLPRASYKDLLVYKGDRQELNSHLSVINSESSPSQLAAHSSPLIIATSSIRRKAQWLHRYPHHTIENLRGNVNTRLRKVAESNWNGAIFAAAGLERINLRPENAIELDWMLPAPAQGAIMVVARAADEDCLQACAPLHHEATAFCTRLERDFLRALLGGCSTPISALAVMRHNEVHFRGSLLSVDGREKIEVEKTVQRNAAAHLGATAAQEILDKGGKEIAEGIRYAGH
jgi:hydroxymethylbilane synthase